MYCSKCNKTGKLVQFNTFQYYYCSDCKVECQGTQPAASNIRQFINYGEPELLVKGWHISYFSGMPKFSMPHHSHYQFDMEEAASIQNGLDEGMEWGQAVAHAMTQTFSKLTTP